MESIESGQGWAGATEPLTPQQQTEINQRSGKAQSELEKDAITREFVNQVNSLPRQYEAKKGTDTNILTVPVPKSAEGKLHVIAQFLGVDEKPTKAWDDQERGQRVEIFEGRTVLHREMYLEVRRNRKNKEVIGAEVGFPRKERLQHLG